MNFQNANYRNLVFYMQLILFLVIMCVLVEQTLALGYPILFDPVTRITSGSQLDQNSNTIGYFGNFPEFMCDPKRITLELSWDQTVAISVY